jgi:phenylpyruvate tautomerase PptA (4-oxalocrotonate tautomerase family)
VPIYTCTVAESTLSADTKRTLAAEIAAAVSAVCHVDADQVLVVIQSSPACSAVEGGRVLPEPGHEQGRLGGG